MICTRVAHRAFALDRTKSPTGQRPVRSLTALPLQAIDGPAPEDQARTNRPRGCRPDPIRTTSRPISVQQNIRAARRAARRSVGNTASRWAISSSFHVRGRRNARPLRRVGSEPRAPAARCGSRTSRPTVVGPARESTRSDLAHEGSSSSLRSPSERRASWGLDPGTSLARVVNRCRHRSRREPHGFPGPSSRAID